MGEVVAHPLQINVTIVVTHPTTMAVDTTTLTTTTTTTTTASTEEAMTIEIETEVTESEEEEGSTTSIKATIIMAAPQMVTKVRAVLIYFFNTNSKKFLFLRK
jgi:hypothetical protein